MFAESESEELLTLLNQVRLVADAEDWHDVNATTVADTTEPAPSHEVCGLAASYSPANTASPDRQASRDTLAPTGSGGGIVSDATPIGRYTASSTAAPVSAGWTVHDNSQKAGTTRGTQPRMEHTDNVPSTNHSTITAVIGGRTPATGAKVLTSVAARSRSEEAQLNTMSSAGTADLYEGLPQPKQLFFMDAVKRNACRGQIASSVSGEGAPAFSTALHHADIVANCAATSVNTPLCPSPSSERSSTTTNSTAVGSAGRGMGLAPTPCHRTAEHNHPDSAAPASPSHSFAHTAVLGMILAGYGETQSSPLAANRHPSAAALEGADAGGGVPSRSGGGTQDRKMSRTEGSLWTSAGSLGSQHASHKASPRAAQPPRSPQQPQQQQHSPAISGTGMSQDSFSSGASSPPAVSAVLQHQQQGQHGRGLERRPTYGASAPAAMMGSRAAHANPNRRTSDGHDSTMYAPHSVHTPAVTSMDPFTARTSPHPQRHQGMLQSASEVTVARFFDDGEVVRSGGGGSGAMNGADVSWPAGVEAELRELQHVSTQVTQQTGVAMGTVSHIAGGAAVTGVHSGGGLGSATSTAHSFSSTAGLAGVAAPRYATPTTTVSPISNSAATPYHQLLSQLRYSPQQGYAAGLPSQNSHLRANTPPNHAAAVALFHGGPASSASSTQRSAFVPAPKSASAATAAAVAMVMTSTTNVDDFVSDCIASARVRGNGSSTAFSSRDDASQTQQPLQQQHRSTFSPSAAEAAALWERLSPYERAAATAAVMGTDVGSGRRGAAEDAFRTPDTVAKPVALSSIAARLHSADEGAPDDHGRLRSYPNGPSQPLSQQKRRYTSPDVFSTAPDVTLLSRPRSGPQLADTVAAQGTYGPLFPHLKPPPPPPSSPPQQQQHPMSTITPAGTPSSGGTSWRRPQQQQQPTRVAPVHSAGSSLHDRLAMSQQPQQQQPTPSGSHRWSPLESTPVTSHARPEDSPPSCSLRPSPQTRGSDGISPALRRYVISTPNHSQNNNNNMAGGMTYPHSSSNLANGGRRSQGGSPLALHNHSSNSGHGGVTPLSRLDGGTYPSTPNGTGNNHGGGGAAARESRPRVQLSRGAALHSPTVSSGTVGGRTGAGVTAIPSASLGGHGHNNSGGGSSPAALTGMTALSGGAAMVGGSTSQTTSVVSAAAVQALTERLEAAAPLILGTPSGLHRAASAASFDGSVSLAELLSSEDGVLTTGDAGGIPGPASASLILAMSHDQHGCRLLQAVLDAECDNPRNLEKPSAQEAPEKAGHGMRNNGNNPVQHHHNWSEEGEENDGEQKEVFLWRSSRQRKDEEELEDHTRGVNGSTTDAQRRATAFCNSISIQVILRAMETKLDGVMADSYGNFLLQKVFDMAPDAERQRLLRLPAMTQHLCDVACSSHGTFAVQRLVETARNSEEEHLVFVALERDLLHLLTNSNGGHVLLKVMDCIRRQHAALMATVAITSTPVDASSEMGSGQQAMLSQANAATAPTRLMLQERVEALFQAIQQHLLYVCQHKQGCCTVQRCLDFFNACASLSATPTTMPGATQSTTTTKSDAAANNTSAELAALQQGDFFDRIAALLLPHVHELSIHPFGNYVVTRLVDICYARGSTGTIDMVATGMQRDLIRMCTNKFASNVVEHILRHCSERRIRSICQTLMRPGPALQPHNNNSSGGALAAGGITAGLSRLPLTAVVMDSFGNYVIQTLLTVAPVDELASESAAEGGMLPVLQQLLPLLSSRNFGRKLETKTELALLRMEYYQQQQKRPIGG